MENSMQKQRTRFLLTLSALWFIPLASSAATITTVQSLSEFDRVLFTGATPQQLRMETRGNAIVLTLSESTGDVSILQTKLKPHVVSVERSADGKKVILNLDKSYRVRQFVSGNTVGIDILKSSETAAALPTNNIAIAPPTSILTTKSVPTAPSPTLPKEAPFKPASAPPKAPEPIVASSVAKPEQAPKKSSILTTKEEAKPAPTPRIAAEKTTAEPKAEPSKLLSTKETPKVELTTKEPPTPAPAVQEIQAALAESPKPESTPAIPVTPNDAEFTEEASPPQPGAVTPEITAPKSTTQSYVTEDILVGVRTEKEGTTIDFPWTERVASAVFQRGRDIWIVFNKESRIDTGRLRTILPTSILNITRYKLPGNTVIKLETNGSINASVESKPGTYAWSVRLVPTEVSAKKDAAVSANADHPKPHLLFQVFDMGNPFSFYDPSIGDRWLIAPLYEAGLGVTFSRKFPTFDVVPSVQGIAVLTQEPAITFEPTRIGLRLTSDKGLDISKDLPYLSGGSAPIKGASSISNVLLPYDRWYIEPGTFFKARGAIIEALAKAPKDMRPEITTQLATLYLSQGFGLEAASILEGVKRDAPEYYVAKKLALVKAAAHFMANHMEEAALAIKSPELAQTKEAEAWKNAIGLYVPMDVRVSGAIMGQDTASLVNGELSESEQRAQNEQQLKQIALNTAIAAKGFDYVAYNDAFIRHYPPSIRQRMAITAANAYVERSKFGNAVRVFDILNKEGLLEPIQLEVEYLLGKIAADRDRPEEARAIWERLANQEKNAMVRARARYGLTLLDYTGGKIDLVEAIKQLDAQRISWRGDGQERELLSYLGQLYIDNKQFDMALRVWRELTNHFPNDPEVVNISTRTAELFEQLFYDGQADELPPLKALALFYEFRELTPVGDKGNAIIQKLADRLAAVDLIDRAAQLLEHQIKFRLAGEERARVGARLALLYLINREPQKALDTLEITNFGDTEEALRFQRLRLSAQALASLDRLDEGLAIMHADQTDEGQLLRLEILWKMKDWANVINQAEDMLAARKDLTSPLSTKETEVLLKLALAYSFEKDFTQLSYLRDYYTSLMAESPYKDIFGYITNNTAPIDPEDFALMTQQISRTENFMKEFRDTIAKGKLSDTVK
jgi:hypothetical protein